jgi:hypothetical protein
LDENNEEKSDDQREFSLKIITAPTAGIPNLHSKPYEADPMAIICSKDQICQSRKGFWKDHRCIKDFPSAATWLIHWPNNLFVESDRYSTCAEWNLPTRIIIAGGRLNGG